MSGKPLQWKPSGSMRKEGQPEKHDEANSRFLQFCESWSTAFAPGCGLFNPQPANVENTVSS